MKKEEKKKKVFFHFYRDVHKAFPQMIISPNPDTTL